MITIGFSSHRVEVLPYAQRLMEEHQVILLEEAPVAEFIEMLRGRLAIDEYVMALDSGFPDFEKLLCMMLRELHSQGRDIIQVEPYLENLLEIHERLAEDETPEDIQKEPRLEGVYRAERRATGALLDYYSRALAAPYDEVIQAVKNFARADAERLVLREQMRAQGIKSLVSDTMKVYVEAGYIHYPLYSYLKRALGPEQTVRVVYLLAPVVRRLQGRRRNMGPGDILTLHYALHGRLREDRADLLAGRSLVYIKLLQKDELLPGDSDAPHSEDEVKVNRVVDRLGLEDCRVIFDQIRLAKREKALEVVEAYVAKKKGTKPI